MIAPLLLRCVIAVVAAQLPVLPEAALRGLPAPVRAELERAYAVARAQPRDIAKVGELAMLLHAYEQLDLAASSYQVARELDSHSLSWPYLSGVVHAERGDHGAAVTAFRTALQIDATYVPARLALANSLMKAGELEGSYREYENLVRQYPELALAHYGLGQLSSAQGRKQEAFEHYREAVRLLPQFGAAQYAVALASRDLGRDDAAREHLAAYRQYADHRPAMPDPVLEQVRSMKGTARHLISEAARLGRAGRLSESIEMHERAIEADPGAAQAHVNLISLYGSTGRLDKAEEHYRSALKLGANLADAHYNYGVLLLPKRRAEAAAAFQKALEANPFHAHAHNNLGSLLAQDRRLKEAAAHFLQAIANDPQHRSARSNLARLIMLSGLQRLVALP